MRTCDRCRKPYRATRPNRRFCSDSCRVMACQQRPRYDRPKSQEPPRRVRIAAMVADLTSSERLREKGPLQRRSTSDGRRRISVRSRLPGAGRAKAR
jgi:hypothetical protein